MRGEERKVNLSGDEWMDVVGGVMRLALCVCVEGWSWKVVGVIR